MMDKMLANREACVPETGFNLVLFDDYEPPGEQLMVVSKHESEEDANKAKAEFEAANKGTAAYIYGPDS